MGWVGHDDELCEVTRLSDSVADASATRWLSDHEQRVWRDFVAATGMLHAHLETQLQRESGMPYTYYEVLVRLSEAPRYTMRMSELAAACNASRSRLSHAVSRMELSGWVYRTSCPSDKRGSFASLTAAGKQALEQAAPGHVAAVRHRLFDVLTDDQITALGEISAAVATGLAATCDAETAAEHEESDSDGTGDVGR